MSTQVEPGHFQGRYLISVGLLYTYSSIYNVNICSVRTQLIGFISIIPKN